MYQRNSSRKLRHRLLSSLLLIGFFGTILSVWAYYSYFVDVGEKGVNEVNSVLVSEHFNVFEPVLPDRTVSLPRDFQFHPEFQARPVAPHPLFTAFLKAASKRKK